MSNATVLAARSINPYKTPQSTRTYPTLQGGCVSCGHMTYEYPTGAWCPCEDCHIGGLFTRTEVPRYETITRRSPKRLTA